MQIEGFLTSEISSQESDRPAIIEFNRIEVRRGLLFTQDKQENSIPNLDLTAVFEKAVLNREIVTPRSIAAIQVTHPELACIVLDETMVTRYRAIVDADQIRCVTPDPGVFLSEREDRYLERHCNRDKV